MRVPLMFAVALLALACGARDSLKVRTGTAPNTSLRTHTYSGDGNVTWTTLQPGPYRVTESYLLEPTDANPPKGSWAVTYYTKRHGAVDLDDLLDKVDSVLAGERR